MVKQGLKISILVLVAGIVGMFSTVGLSAQSTDTGLVLGTTTVVSGPTTVKTPSTTTANTTSGSVASTETQANTGVTSPLVIICLVAGAILIVGLLLFLFFRGNDETTA